MREDLLKIWMKLPLLVRSVLLGFAISTIGVTSWALIATVIPMPWSFLGMIGVLWAYWKYFSGSWAPDSTKEFRTRNFRRQHLTGSVWRLSLIAALLIVLIEQSGLVVTFRVIEFPAERFSAEYGFVESVPLWAAWLVIIMISAVAAICEECGFRGYMQTPLEGRYGPVAAIAIVSVVFVLVHLHQAWSGPVIVQIFFISVLFGVIAYSSGSLIPGMAAHFVMVICNFSFWWTSIGWQFDYRPIGETGIDVHFIVWSVIFVLSVTAFVYVTRRLLTFRT